MKQLITNKSPQSLIDTYINNPTFHAVVVKHEIAESNYQEMLEDAVAKLAQDVARKNEMLLKYSRRFGALDAAISNALSSAAAVGGRLQRLVSRVCQ